MFDWFFEYVVDSTTIKIVVAAVDEALVPMLMMHMLEKLTYILCSILGSILLLHTLENCPCAPMNFVNKTKFISFYRSLHCNEVWLAELFCVLPGKPPTNIYWRNINISKGWDCWLLHKMTPVFSVDWFLSRHKTRDKCPP